MRILTYSILSLALGTVSARAAEQIGPLHRIVEPDMLEEIYRVLKEKEKNGEIAKHQQDAVERTKKAIANPRPVAGLTRTEKARTFYFDPSIVAKETIRDHEGRVIAEAGKRANPLDYVNMSKHLLFFDGTDPLQVAKAAALIKHYGGQVKPIMVNGPVMEISKQWDQQVYFDQGGVLVRKLGITRVPSLVSQEGKKLRIDELEV